MPAQLELSSFFSFSLFPLSLSPFPLSRLLFFPSTLPSCACFVKREHRASGFHASRREHVNTRFRNLRPRVVFLRSFFRSLWPRVVFLRFFLSFFFALSLLVVNKKNLVNIDSSMVPQSLTRLTVNSESELRKIYKKYKIFFIFHRSKQPLFKPTL